MALQLGQRLRAARERAGLSQAETCRRIAGLGESSLSEFENDRRTPSLAQLDQLARVYARSVASFLADDDAPTQSVLWRQRPSEGADELEAKFVRLAEQYANLETWCKDAATSKLRDVDVKESAQSFTRVDAEELARTIRRDLALGDRPGHALLRVLEEDAGVKVFHLAFEPSGTAACARSPQFGDAILLNARNKRWRRNFDLAHELFHLLTWGIFRPASATSTKSEESLADFFAANLLLPDEAVRSAVTRRLTDNKLSTAAVFEIVRDFDVSIDALLWRLHNLYGGKDTDYTRKRIDALRAVEKLYDDRSQDPPPSRPDRFRALAVTALRAGDMSIGRFAEYLGITRGEAMKYVEQEAPPDEALELPPP
jgi:Zn-dependent peptidase ImmA (M78 family)/DNA-binding XRE family transcriptional regulator